MNRNRTSALGPVLLGLFAFAVGVAAIAVRPVVLAAQMGPAGATSISLSEQPDVVDIPGIGRVDLNELDPEYRENLRIPGEAYEEQPEEELGDLPPPVFERQTDDSDLPYKPELNTQPAQPATSEVSAADSGGVSKDSEKRAAAHAEALKRKEEIRERMYNDRAYPFGKIPDHAYEDAWKHIQGMPPAPDSAAPADDTDSPDPGPQSLWNTVREWLVARLSPSGVIAQGSPPAWAPAGPAPLYGGPSTSDTVLGGYVGQIAVHPTNLNTVYVGTYGGIWKTTDGGITWSNLTSDQETQGMNRVVLHPGNPSVVYAGTTWGYVTGDMPQKPNPTPTPGTFSELGRGILRSVNDGAVGSWCRIGPVWPLGGSNDQSNLTIFNITIDASRNRLYAATDRGLFYSDNADSGACPGSPGTQVQWTHLSQPTNSTGLPMLNGQPDNVGSIAVGHWSNQVLYATMFTNVFPPNNNGAYRSSDGGLTWAPINSGFPAYVLLRNDIAVAKNPPPNPTPTPQRDILYLSGGAATPCPPFGTETVYRGVSYANGSTTWTALKDPGDPCTPAFNAQVPIRSVAIHPTDPYTVAVGAYDVFLSTDGGSTFADLTVGGPEGVHPDQNDLVFGPALSPGNPNSLYTGNDGGIWRRDRYDLAPFNDWNGNLANFLFHRGTIDTLNHGVSWGGTQDNGDMKGGNPLAWNQIQTGDGTTNLVDWSDSKIAYFVDRRTTDGGLTTELIKQGLTDANWQSMTMDPSNSKALVIHDFGGTQPTPTPDIKPQIYRRVFGVDSQWNSITDSPSSGLPDIAAIAIAPSQAPPEPSNLIFAGVARWGGSGGDIWRTENAGDWTSSLSPSNGLPNHGITSLQIAPGACTVPNCTLYASVSGFLTDHVFRSTDAGATWSSISGSGTTALPDLPVSDIVVQPTDATVLWAGTDLGVFKGCLSSDGQTCSASGTSWIWGTYNTNFPAGMFVIDLDIHKESGLLRAFTLGRGAWEVQAFSPPNPDQRVNTSDAGTGSYHNTVRVSSGNSGHRYAVAWVEDREGANNSHVRWRPYTYDAGGQPTPAATDFRVDDTFSSHAVQAVSLSYHPTNLSGYYSWLAWNDDRLDHIRQHVYYNWIQQNGSRLYTCKVSTPHFRRRLRMRVATFSSRGKSTILPHWMARS